MKKVKVLLICAIVATSLYGCKKAPVLESAETDQPLACLKVEADSVSIEKVFPGVVLAKVVAQVRPQVTGIVLEKDFEGGEKVEAGQLLYKIDDRTYRANLELAASNLAIERAKLSNLLNQEKRYKLLFEKNATSREAYENLRSQRLQSEATISKLQAEERLAKIDLENSQIRSPIEGFISKPEVDRGSLVSANQEKPMATVRETETMYVDIRPPSEIWKQLWDRNKSIGKDSPLNIYLLRDSGSFYKIDGKDASGAIKFIEKFVDGDTGTVLVRVEFKNPDQQLKDGEVLKALIVKEEKDQVMVPQKYLQLNANHEHYVLVAFPSGQDGHWKFKEQPVRLLFSIGDKWSIEGLQPGSIIVLSSKGLPEKVTLSHCQ